jgi:hypothetical protein
VNLDKKVTTAFVITAIAFVGTGYAALRTTTTTESIQFGNIFTKTTTTTTADNHSNKPAITVSTSQEADLAAVILRISGISVRVEEITTLKARNMGNGEIVLAYNLAQSSGKSVEEILYMRHERKMGWGNIAKVLGVKLHGSVDKSVSILRESKLDTDADNFLLVIRVDLDDEASHGNDKGKAVSHDTPHSYGNNGNDKNDKNDNNDKNDKNDKDDDKLHPKKQK